MILGAILVAGIFPYELPALSAAWEIGYISDMTDEEYTAWTDAGYPNIQRWIGVWLSKGNTVKL